MEATYLLWFDASYYNIEELIDSMYNYEYVGIMSGSVYGDENYLRINIGCPKSKLEDGLERLLKSVRRIE